MVLFWIAVVNFVFCYRDWGQHELSLKDQKSQTVRVRLMEIHIHKVRIPNKLTVKGQGVNLKTVDSIWSESQSRRKCAFTVAKHELSLKNHHSQMVIVSFVSILKHNVHITNKLNIKGHCVNLITDSLTANTMNVEFPPALRPPKQSSLS